MGIVAPVVGTFAGTPSNGAGALDVSATYQYKVTFYNAALDHESNPSLPITVTTGATDDTVTLSNIPISSDPQVTRRRLYRTQAGGAVWQFLDEIADNTTTVYVDLKADSALGIAVTEFANGVPPTASMLAIFQGIMFMVAVANPSRVYFSTQNRPNAVDSNDFRDLDPNDGTVITGLKRLYDTLVVFKRNSIWAGVGEDRETLGFVRQINGIGATCNDGILTVPGKTVLAFPSDNGFYTFNGTNEAYISSEIEPIYRQGGLNQSRLTTMVGTTYKARNMLMWFVSNGAAIQHDLAIVYDFTLDQWTTRSVAATRVNVAATITDSAGNEGFYIGGVGGFVWKGDTGLSDDGSAIQVDIIDRAHPRGNLTNTSRLSFRELWVWYRSELATTITVSYALDNPHVDDPDGNYTVLGTMNLTEGDGVSSLRFNAQGQRFYPRFTHTAIGAPLVIRGWAVDYKVLDRQS